MNSKNALKTNTFSGLINQIVVLVCGLILPRLILKAYGSNVNGLVNSITSILNVISLLELGVGAVVQTALYKPLANNDIEKVNKICQQAKKFFKVIASIFIVYIIASGTIFSLFESGEFDFLFTFMLFIAISISMFAQYYFGIVNNILLKADQKIYFVNFIQMITIILNTLGCYLLIKYNFSIQVVKFFTSGIYLLRPLFLWIYVSKKYDLKKIKHTEDVLPQKWNGIAQHISSYVLENTDILVLTIFSTLSNVSIYSIYYLIAKALHQLIYSLTGGVQSFYGQLFATNQTNKLKKSFEKYTIIISNISAIVFGIAITSIVPFITLYTKTITDADYKQKLFAVLLLFGHFLYCFRYCFNILIISMGKFKETQISAIIEAVINLTLSILLVINYGLIGVAIGTIVALLFRILYFVIFLQKNGINNSVSLFIKQSVTCFIIIILSILMTLFFPFEVSSYFSWVIYTLIRGLIILFTGIIVAVLVNIKFFMNKEVK